MSKKIRFGPFQWDLSKERQNIKKHRLGFREALMVFVDPNRVEKKDLGHSQIEDRRICIGRVGEKIATVRYTWRGDSIRIIGAGFWRKGRQEYEEKNTKKT